MAAISITAASVFKSSGGQLQTGTAAAGTTITAGQALYTTALNTLGLADANGTTPANSFTGISLNGGGPGQPIAYIAADTAFTFGGTASSGADVYVDSTTPGAITATYADVASGSTVLSIGTVLTGGTTMILAPRVGGVK